jgi:hypothetical protein
MIFSNLWQQIKNYILATTSVVAAVFAALFFYEKNKNTVNDALLKEEKLNQDLAKDQQAIDSNNVQLKIEEQKREELEKNENSTDASIGDITKFLNDRK